jgi:hypothetical protein
MSSAWHRQYCCVQAIIGFDIPDALANRPIARCASRIHPGDEAEYPLDIDLLPLWSASKKFAAAILAVA